MRIAGGKVKKNKVFPKIVTKKKYLKKYGDTIFLDYTFLEISCIIMAT